MKFAKAGGTDTERDAQAIGTSRKYMSKSPAIRICKAVESASQR